MTISHNKIIDLPIFLEKESRKIGYIKDIIIDHQSGLFLSLVVVSPASEKLYALIKDVKEFKEDEIIIKSEDSLINLDDIPGKIKDIIQKNIKIKGNKVFTISGENLGEVSDFEIDPLTYKISKIYVSGGIIRKLIRGELIILKNQIISIKKDKIIVEDIIARKKQKNKIAPEEEKELAGVSFSIKTK